ncbi:MAG TPA: hypothetical protein VK541_23920 [Pedobacter sp.]|uniref:hypothetical protein n=1 Tax=Pedobacter sp. TaxID=1411316 RepID=UPI002B5F84C8|nr:hypothetical protein [Pedobacter sp.]HMI05558.1 hypothetical protein [Pedobacter sp.]
MELDQLKSTWNKAETPAKTNEELKAMLLESRHPVLKEIRKQFIIEITGWSAFLLCYYTMFDGDQKPMLVNLILVIAVLCSLIHNLSGYSFSRYLINGSDIKASLGRYLSKIKTFAVISVCTRLLFMAGFLLFFTYNIQFNATKYLLLTALLLVFLGQLIWLGNLWAKRVRTLAKTIGDF